MTAGFSFARALKAIRKSSGRSQEAFTDLSSRSYVSRLERGMNSPTLKKVDQLCKGIGVHPLTMLTLAYAPGSKGGTEKLIARVQRELAGIASDKDD